MRLKVSAICDRGKLRPVNEDNLFINGFFLPELHEETYSTTKRFSTLTKPLFAVFDGMGGYDAGEKASFLAAETTGKLSHSHPSLLRSKRLLSEICAESNRAICEEMAKNRNGRMGSTASILLFSGKRYFLCNIGDSPIFLMQNGHLQIISAEHTERALYESVTGKKTDPRQKFRLTQNIGIFPDEMILEPYYSEGDLHIGDTFLICSDGITDMLDTTQIKRILQHEDVSVIAQELLSCALDSGGKDNITAIVIRCSK